MTIPFISLAALMLIAALAFVVPPLLRGNVADPAMDARRKLRALDNARSDGILSDAEYATKRAALDEILLARVEAKPTRVRANFFAALAIVLVLPVAAVTLYRLVGAPQALDATALAGSPASASMDHDTDMQAAIVKLSEQLKQNPDDAEGWTMLGRAYKATQHFADARDALKRAHDLAANDAGITVEYAEALALASPDHRIAGKPRALLDQALEIDPQNQRGLWLSGIADSQEKNYSAAVATWSRLLPLLPADSDVAASVRKQIAQAEALRDGRAPPAENESAASAANVNTAKTSSASAANATPDDGPHIKVEVTLDPKLKDKVAPDDVLFVFAKAASGPPMPLAIARLTAAQLPASVTLTDGMGMLPNMKLSQFPQVIIGARISKSGQAIAQSGDLQTLSAPLPTTRSEPVRMTIDQIVP